MEKSLTNMGTFRFVVDRRRFLQMTSSTAAYLGLSRWAWAFSQSPNVPLFGTTLRGLGSIPVALPDPVNPGWWQPGVTHYTINIDQFQDGGVAPTLGPTTLRGFNPTIAFGPTNRHLGGILVAQKGIPVQITFRNNIPSGPHIIP